VSSVPSYLVFDFETSGLEPQRDRIIQVGLCSVVNGAVTNRRGWLVRQNVAIHPEATQRHGLTMADLEAGGIAPRESLVALLDAMREAPTCMGHNIHRFDIPFLRAECRRFDVRPPHCTDFIDTAALFKGWKLGERKGPGETFEDYADRVLSRRVAGLRYAIPTCVTELRITEDTSRLHDASHDAYVTHLIFQALRRIL